MASEIDRKLKGLALTEEEEEIVDCEEEESKVMQEQLNLCLVGKLLSKNPYSIEALKNTMKIAWRLMNGMVVREIESNLFMFQFFSYPEKMKVLDDGPWSFDGSPLLLKEVDSEVQPSEIIFDSIRIWIKAYDVPLEKRTKSMAISMALKMGTFVEYDDVDPLGWNKYMRFRVDLKLDKPLRRGIRVAVKGGSKWVEFRYERLMEFCYACGCFGHAYQGCSHYDDATPEGELPYGAWLRASPTRKRRGVNPKVEEEKRMCQVLRGTLEESRAKMRLNFTQEEMNDDTSHFGANGGIRQMQALESTKQNKNEQEAIMRGHVGEMVTEQEARVLKRGRIGVKENIIAEPHPQKAFASDTPMYDTFDEQRTSCLVGVSGSLQFNNNDDITAEIGIGQSRRSQ